MAGGKITQIGKGSGKGSRQTYNPDGFEEVEKTFIDGATGAVSAANGVVGAFGMIPFLAPILAGLGISTAKGVGKITGSGAITNFATDAETRVTSITEKKLVTSLGGNRFFAPIGRGATSLATKSSNLLSSIGLKGAASVVADVPKALAEKPVATGLMEASFIAGSGLQMASGALGFGKSLIALKQMAFDLTGKKYSSFEVLFGDVPEVVKAERGQILKSLAVEEGGGALSMGVAVKSAARVVAGWVWPVVMGATVGASMLVGEGMLADYDQASKAFNTGQPLPPDIYAKIIGASKELTNHGGAGGPFAQAIATQYAAENANPADVIREMENGTLKQRIHKIIAENDARTPAKTEEKAPQTTIAEQPKISHVAALEQPRERRPLAHLENKRREIVGDKTREIVNAELANSQLAQQAM